MEIPNASGRTVLLVEDDPNDRMIFHNAFERAAPDVGLRMCVDGEDAVEYLSGTGAYADRSRNPSPDMVLLDLKLPRKSGMEVLGWMRDRTAFRQVPVFMLSSSQERSDINLAFALGANSYLVKGADIKALRGVVRGIGAYVELVARRRQETP